VNDRCPSCGVPAEEDCPSCAIGGSKDSLWGCVRQLAWWAFLLGFFLVVILFLVYLVAVLVPPGRVDLSLAPVNFPLKVKAHAVVHALDCR